VIKGVEWCVKNTPKNMHIYPLFIKPEELKDLCLEQNLQIKKLLGFRPAFNKALFKMIYTREVPDNVTFRFSKSLATGYCGYFQKE
jgi:2-polyprenyl-6-hydroxyphenyl methylase/3-demethylubiquinone-9 3-methyltransferase